VDHYVIAVHIRGNDAHPPSLANTVTLECNCGDTYQDVDESSAREQFDLANGIE
jgi:hypothetical protein